MTKNLLARVAILVLLICLGEAESASAKGFARITDRMREFIAGEQISGAVTLVARRGQVVHLEAIGYADVEHKRPMQKDTIFAIASMTKPLTATAVMILQDEGRLSIHDPVSKYIPKFKETSLATGPPQREITIRDLLTHTSGMVGSQQNQGTLKETADKIAGRHLNSKPGTRWQYSPGLTVCGRIIEVVSGRAYDKYLAERVFQPLRMTNTTFFPNANQRKRIARLYKPGEKTKSIEATTHWLSDLSGARTANPSGGLFSTATDMARFYQMVLNGGELDGTRIVSKAAVKQMTTIQTGELQTGFTPGNGWGLGWCVIRDPQGVTGMLSRGTYGHGGAFGTQGWVDPERQMLFVLMIQRTGFGNSDGSEVRRVFQEYAVQSVD